MRIAVVAAGAVLFLSGSAARAQQPFSTEEPDTAQPGSAKISVGVEFDALRPEDTEHHRQTTLLTRAGYGVMKNLELEFSAPVIHLGNVGTPSATGYGDTSVSAKYAVRATNAEDPRWPCP